MNQNNNDPLYVLGIDQGLANLGYSIISNVPSLTFEHPLSEKYQVIESGVFNTSANKALTERLKDIFNFLKGKLESYKCIAIGCEKLFHNNTQKNGRNKSAAIVKTNMVTGLIYLLGGLFEIPVFEFVPGTVKKVITGKGNATKEEMINEIEKWLMIKFLKKEEHRVDSIGIGVTTFPMYERYLNGELLEEEIKEEKKSKNKSKNSKIKKTVEEYNIKELEDDDLKKIQLIDYRFK